MFVISGEFAATTDAVKLVQLVQQIQLAKRYGYKLLKDIEDGFFNLFN